MSNRRLTGRRPGLHTVDYAQLDVPLRCLRKAAAQNPPCSLTGRSGANAVHHTPVRPFFRSQRVAHP